MSSLEVVSAVTKTAGNSVFTRQLREGGGRREDESTFLFGVDWC